MGLKNQLWIGSIKDMSNVWHPVVASPDEDYCHTYCQRVIPETEHDDYFWSQTYTVELLPIVITEAYMEEEEWFDKGNWEEFNEDDTLYEELD